MISNEQSEELRRWVAAWRYATKVIAMELPPALTPEMPSHSELISDIRGVEQRLNESGLGLVAQQAWFSRLPRV